MISNLTNNMIVCLTTTKTIHNSGEDNLHINDVNDINDLNQVNIDTIITNAKNDKRFHKLLSLCIKYDIHIFNQCNNICTILDIDNLLTQSNEKQKKLAEELSTKISDISSNGPSNDWLIDIENIYIQYRKKFKDIEIIIYVLKNIFNDESLKSLCCISNSSSSSNSKQTCKKKDISKYIAVYSN
jgi:hypothetical protein